MVDHLAFYEQRREAMRVRPAKLFGAKPDDIRHAATIVATPIDLPALMPPCRRQSLRLARARQLEAAHRRSGSFETSISDLLQAGAITAGTELTKTYRGVAYTVAVRSDGRLEGEGGEIFESPSQAARLLTGQKAVNGRASWLTPSGSPVGDLRPES